MKDSHWNAMFLGADIILTVTYAIAGSTGWFLLCLGLTIFSGWCLARSLKHEGFTVGPLALAV